MHSKAEKIRYAIEAHFSGCIASCQSQNDAIASRLRLIRRAANLTQVEFAEFLRIPRDRLASYEQRRAPLPCSLAYTLCRDLGVNPYWLAEGRGVITGRNRDVLGDAHTVFLREANLAKTFLQSFQDFARAHPETDPLSGMRARFPRVAVPPPHKESP